MDGVVRVDITRNAYVLCGISFPFTFGEHGWVLDQAYFINLYSETHNERFEMNFNRKNLAEEKWQEATENDRYIKIDTIVCDGTLDEDQAQHKKYLWIPALEFLPSDYQKDTVKRAGDTLSGSLDVPVSKLKPRQTFGPHSRSIDRDYIPPGIAFPGPDKFFSAFLDTAYNLGKHYLR